MNSWSLASATLSMSMDHPRYQIRAAPARGDLPRNGDVGKVLLKDPFLPKSVRGYREAMEEEARAFFGEWRGEERDLAHEMLALSLRLLGRALFGEPLSP